MSSINRLMCNTPVSSSEQTVRMASDEHKNVDKNRNKTTPKSVVTSITVESPISSDSISSSPDVTLCDNTFFKRMLDLIPAHFYFNHEAREKLHAKRSHTENSQDDNEDAATVRAQRKRAKFDPKALTTVTELQQQLVDQEEEERRTDKKKKSVSFKLTKPQLTKSDTTDKGPSSTTTAVCEGDISTEHLSVQQKFQEKLRLLQEKRKAHKEDRHTLLERRKRKKLRKQKLKKLRTEKLKSLPNGGGATDDSFKNKHSGKNASKPMFNKDGHIVFSKFDFTATGQKAAEKRKKKGSDLAALTGKNYKQILEKVEKKKQKLLALESKDKEAAKGKKDKELWQKALLKAEGVKIKDDEAVLKKSLKRKEKIKQRSKAKWDDRLDRVDKKKKDKQEKRKANIKNKKDARTNKKIKRAKKKGHILPGF